MPARQSSRPILVKSDHFDLKEEISMRNYKRLESFHLGEPRSSKLVFNQLFYSHLNSP